MTDASAWQPIETAPMKRHVLVYWQGDILVADQDPQGRWWYCSTEGEYECAPSHWMPLPEPPEEPKP